MRKRKGEIHGLLIVDKPGMVSTVRRETLSSAGDPAQPAGFRLPTSHDVIQMVRRWSGQRRIGHTGTLDPMASGVLVLCLGYATRLAEYYQGQHKQYYAEIMLGVATDTYDVTGTVVHTAAPPRYTRCELERFLQQFRGTILQIPPLYSAIKRGGETLYRKARRGETVELNPRPVTVHQLTLVDYAIPDRICLRIRCSAGTYIRSLAHDLGQAMGTYACLSGLRREAVGLFTLEQAYELAQLESAAARGRIGDCILAPGTGLLMPKLRLSPGVRERLGYGQQVTIGAGCAHLLEGGSSLGDNSLLAQAVDDCGNLAGVIRYLGQAEHDPGATTWKAEKWFARS